MTIGKAIFAGVLFAAMSKAAIAGDPAAGEKIFLKCKVCHDVGEGAKNKIGPLLNGLDGRRSGTIEGYAYTEANKNSNVTWSEATFKEYITNPKAKIPGTKMVFVGLPNEQDRDDLWAYIIQFKPDGAKK